MREILKRLGTRLVMQNICVTNAVVATCVANCLRILHSSLGPSIVRIIYLMNQLFSSTSRPLTAGTYLSDDVLRYELCNNLIHDLFFDRAELCLLQLDKIINFKSQSWESDHALFGRWTVGSRELLASISHQPSLQDLRE